MIGAVPLLSWFSAAGGRDELAVVDVMPLAPASASTVAPEVDLIFYLLSAISVVFTVGIFVTILALSIRYRRRPGNEVGADIHGSVPLELLWSGIPLVIALSIFAMSARTYFHMNRPPRDTLDIYAVAKQWMWKFQHPDGKREINNLHVPLGQPVRVILSSEDVLHSLFVPAFRVKMDAIPGRFTNVWFEATRTGEYHLFCAEYCGTEHSQMGGTVIVMEPQAYQAWLGGEVSDESPAEAGARRFEQMACNTCHTGATPLGPRLEGILGRTIALADGTEIVADEEYLRESILNPMAKVSAGYPPIMPTFQGQVSEDGLMQLIVYIRTLGGEEESK